MSGVITTALYGLLKQGKENCCEIVMPAAQENSQIFSTTEMEGKEEPTVEVVAEPEIKQSEEPIVEQKVEETTEKEPAKTTGKKPPKKGKGIGSLFLEWFNNATSDPEYENETANNDQ